MKLIRLLPCVAAATLLLPAGVAAAQDNQVVDVKSEKACGTVTLTLTNRDIAEYGFTYTTGPFAGGPAGERGLIVVPSNKTVSQTIRFAEDSFDGQGFVTLGVAYGPNTHRQTFLDLGLVDTDCALPVTDPSTTPSATPSTTPSTTPSATPSTTPSSAPESSTSASSTPVVIGDAEFGQVGEVPVGSVDTGRA